MKKKKLQVQSFLPVNNLKDTLTYYRERLGFYDEWTWGEFDGGFEETKCALFFSKHLYMSD